MNRLDFTDINKFITSIGVILIVLAFLLPWYVQSNIEVLKISEHEISHFTCESQKTISAQQSYLLFVNEYLVVIMIFLIILGFSIALFGLIRWNTRQEVEYQLRDEELRIKRMEGITPSEKLQSIKDEIQSSNNDEPILDLANQYIEIENIIYFKLANYYRVNYTVQQNLRVDQYEFDVILKSKYIQKRNDFIIEIKHFKKEVSFQILKEQLVRLLQGAAYYEQILNRPSVSIVLILVFTSKDIFINEEIINKLLNEGIRFGKSDIRITQHIINEVELTKAPLFVQNGNI